MPNPATIPDSPLEFIRSCTVRRRILWTSHVSMRLQARGLPRSLILSSVDRYEIIESYPDDKYFPSYLVFTENLDGVLHILFAVDTIQDNVRVITAYRPDPDDWREDFRRRRT